MKKRFITSLALAAALSAQAQEVNTMAVGYCGDESATAIGLYEKDVNIAAVEFSGDFLQQYAGNKIKSIIIQLGASFGSAGSVFLTDKLNDDASAPYAIEQEIPDFDYVPCYRWIEVPLSETITISPDKPFYAGIRILPYTKAPYYGQFQFAVEDNAAAAHRSYIYDAGKGRWAHTTDYSFEDVTAPNHLIKLCLEGDALPVNDVCVTNLQTIDYMRTSDTCSCTFDVTNKASNVINEFDAALYLDGVLTKTDHIALDAPLATNQTTSYSFEGISFTGEGTHTIMVQVTNVNGVADLHPEDNSSENEVSVIDRYFDHTVLVEAFTTMSCANCPNAHEREEEAFTGLDRIVRVDHHSGFGTDILTTQVDRDFLWFFANGGTTYAPGIMFDREMVDDFFDPQRSPGEENSPIIGPGDVDNLRFIHSHLAARPAYVDVNIEAAYDKNTRKLDITVSGEAIAKLRGDNTTINVWLTESGLSAANDPRLGQMTGSGRADMTFVHNNALRATLTDSWGTPITLGLAPYSQTFSTTLKSDWKPENMEIVAFIANYDKNHTNNCMVHNSAAAPVIGNSDTNGVAAIVSAHSLTTSAYDLYGRKVTAAPRGITIVDGKKVVR